MDTRAAWRARTPGACARVAWHQAGLNTAHTSFQPADKTSITAADVPSLQPLWTHGGSGDRAAVIGSGRLFAGGYDALVALRADTGMLRWTQDEGDWQSGIAASQGLLAAYHAGAVRDTAELEVFPQDCTAGALRGLRRRRRRLRPLRRLPAALPHRRRRVRDLGARVRRELRGRDVAGRGVGQDPPPDRGQRRLERRDSAYSEPCIVAGGTRCDAWHWFTGDGEGGYGGRRGRECGPIARSATPPGGLGDVIALAGDRVYVAGQGGTVLAYPASCAGGCTPVWQAQSADHQQPWAIVVGGDVVYAYNGSHVGGVSAFDAQCTAAVCAPLWILAPDGTYDTAANPIMIAGGRLYVASKGHFTAYGVPAPS